MQICTWIIVTVILIWKCTDNSRKEHGQMKTTDEFMWGNGRWFSFSFIIFIISLMYNVDRENTNWKRLLCFWLLQNEVFSFSKQKLLACKLNLNGVIFYSFLKVLMCNLNIPKFTHLMWTVIFNMYTESWSHYHYPV